MSLPAESAPQQNGPSSGQRHLFQKVLGRHIHIRLAGVLLHMYYKHRISSFVKRYYRFRLLL